MAADWGQVALVYGGQAAEREISLRSGQAILQALRSAGVQVTAIDLAADVFAQLAEGSFDRVFIAVHGRGGEDGALQGGLELLGLPYTGSRVLGSALAMDKLRSKWVWQNAGLPIIPYVEVASATNLTAQVAELGLPLMVKPGREGSSLGMSQVTDLTQLAAAVAQAQTYDSQVLVERWISGREFTVAILGERALPAIQLLPAQGFYDYQAKYVADDTQYLCPCGLSEEDERRLQQLALQAFKALGCEGWGRIDVMQDAAGEFWLLEANTVPGMTDHSLVPMAAKAAGMSFQDLVMAILATSEVG